MTSAARLAKECLAEVSALAGGSVPELEADVAAASCVLARAHKSLLLELRCLGIDCAADAWQFHENADMVEKARKDFEGQSGEIVSKHWACCDGALHEEMTASKAQWHAVIRSSTLAGEMASPTPRCAELLALHACGEAPGTAPEDDDQRTEKLKEVAARVSAVMGEARLKLVELAERIRLQAAAAAAAAAALAADLANGSEAPAAAAEKDLSARAVKKLATDTAALTDVRASVVSADESRMSCVCARLRAWVRVRFRALPLSICLYVCLSIYLSMYPSMYLSF